VQEDHIKSQQRLLQKKIKQREVGGETSPLSQGEFNLIKTVIREAGGAERRGKGQASLHFFPTEKGEGPIFSYCGRGQIFPLGGKIRKEARDRVRVSKGGKNLPIREGGEKGGKPGPVD